MKVVWTDDTPVTLLGGGQEGSRQGHFWAYIAEEHPYSVYDFTESRARDGPAKFLAEFRIMLLLASRPYYAFTRQQIADEVSTDRHLLSEEAIDAYIASLRNQLGVFNDFVQSVPYVGYRFKA